MLCTHGYFIMYIYILIIWQCKIAAKFRAWLCVTYSYLLWSNMTCTCRYSSIDTVQTSSSVCSSLFQSAGMYMKRESPTSWRQKTPFLCLVKSASPSPKLLSFSLLHLRRKVLEFSQIYCFVFIYLPHQSTSDLGTSRISAEGVLGPWYRDKAVDPLGGVSGLDLWILNPESLFKLFLSPHQNIGHFIMDLEPFLNSIFRRVFLVCSKV